MPPPSRPSAGRSRTVRAALLAVVVLLAGACGGGDEPAAPSPSPTATASPSPSPTPTGSAALAPLTGRPAGQDLSDRPVVAVKVENTEAAEPQAGLAEADVVLEELVEGGVTRFVALFHSTLPDRIGPVRSARLVDADVLPAYHPVLGYSGARDEVSAALRQAAIGLVVEGEGGGWTRDASRSGSHNLFASGPGLLAAGADLPAVRPLTEPVWPHDEPFPSPCRGCAEQAQVDLAMSGAVTVTWRWDDGAGVYRRSQNGEPTQLEGGAEVGAANVLALGMQTGTGGCCDTAGNPYTVTEVVGSGQGLLLRDGRTIPVEWSKRAADEHLVVVGPSGEPVPLAPGPTWVQLMPAGNVPGPATP